MAFISIDSMTDYEEELEIAQNLVKNTLAITEWFWERNFKSYAKKDDTPVSIADLASQIYINSQLKQEFPGDQLIAEEDATFAGDEELHLIKECFTELNVDIPDLKGALTYRGSESERQWVIDPIDGTQGYIKELFYAVAIGFMHESDPKACAVAMPRYNERGLAVFLAEKDEGTKASYGGASFQPVSVNNEENLNEITLCRSLHHDTPWIDEFAQRANIEDFIRLDSMGKFCMIADGTAALYIKPLDSQPSFSWDYLPPALILTEAGGKYTDFKGNPITFEGKECKWKAGGVIGSNGFIHDEALTLIDQLDVL